MPKKLYLALAGLLLTLVGCAGQTQHVPTPTPTQASPTTPTEADICSNVTRKQANTHDKSDAMDPVTASMVTATSGVNDVSCGAESIEIFVRIDNYHGGRPNIQAGYVPRQNKLQVTLEGSAWQRMSPVGAPEEPQVFPQTDGWKLLRDLRHTGDTTPDHGSVFQVNLTGQYPFAVYVEKRDQDSQGVLFAAVVVFYPDNNGKFIPFYPRTVAA